MILRKPFVEYPIVPLIFKQFFNFYLTFIQPRQEDIYLPISKLVSFSQLLLTGNKVSCKVNHSTVHCSYAAHIWGKDLSLRLNIIVIATRVLSLG